VTKDPFVLHSSSPFESRCVGQPQMAMFISHNDADSAARTTGPCCHGEYVLVAGTACTVTLNKLEVLCAAKEANNKSKNRVLLTPLFTTQ